MFTTLLDLDAFKEHVEYSEGSAILRQEQNSLDQELTRR